MTARLGHFGTDDVDPTVRRYAIGDDALQRVIPLAASSPSVAVDIETAGLAELSYTVKILIVATETEACVLDASNRDHVAATREALDLANGLDYHNAEFDVPPMVYWGALSLDAIDKVTCTLIYARMGLAEDFAGRDLGTLERTILKASTGAAQKDRFAKWAKINFKSKAEAFAKASYNDPAYYMYAGYDGIITARLKKPLIEKALAAQVNHDFGRYGADIHAAAHVLTREQVHNRVLLRRAARGVNIARDLTRREQERLMSTQDELDATLRGYGVDSPTNKNQLIELIKDDLPPSYPRTAKTGAPSTSKKHLPMLDLPVARAFVEYQENNRLINYFMNGVKIADVTDGKMRPTASIMKAKTGRTAYSNPETHQFTAPAREMILKDDDHKGLCSLDWSQIEPVILANLAGDTGPLSRYESPEGGDLYAVAAAAARVPRKQAKVILLGGMYGQGEDKLADGLGVPNPREVQAKVFGAMPMSFRLIKWIMEWARLTGKTFTMSGRIVPADLAYQAVNFTIQGSAYDLLSECVYTIWQQGMADHVYLTQHDELIVSEDVAEEVQQIMQTPTPRLIDICGRVPLLRTDIAYLGDRWRTPVPCACGSEKALMYNNEGGWTCGDCRG